MHLLAVSLTVLPAELGVVARAGRVLLPVDALSPSSPITPVTVDGTRGGVAVLVLGRISITIISSIVRSVTCTFARTFARAARFAARCPCTPIVPLAVDRARRLVTRLGLRVIAVTIATAIEWSFAGASPIAEATRAGSGAV